MRFFINQITKNTEFCGKINAVLIFDNLKMY